MGKDHSMVCHHSGNRMFACHCLPDRKWQLGRAFPVTVGIPCSVFSSCKLFPVKIASVNCFQYLRLVQPVRLKSKESMDDEKRTHGFVVFHTHGDSCHHRSDMYSYLCSRSSIGIVEQKVDPTSFTRRANEFPCSSKTIVHTFPGTHPHCES